MDERTEMLELIHKIKSYKEPPWDKHDAYWQRDPWRKFGCVSSGICMCWCWYRDEVIMRNADANDVAEALRQLEHKR